MYKGKQVYMLPVTRILTDEKYIPKVIEKCTNIVDPAYQIGTDHWITVSDRKTIATPKKLELMTLERKLQFTEFDKMEQSGLYSQQALESARKYALFTVQRDRVLTILVDKVYDGGVKREPDFELLLSPDHFKKAAMSTLKSIWGKFQTFGNIFSGFLGIYYMVMAGKLLFSSLLSFKQLHMVFGKTWKLIKCFYPFLAKYLITSKHSRDIQRLIRKDDSSDENKGDGNIHMSYIPVPPENFTNSATKVIITENPVTREGRLLEG